MSKFVLVSFADDAKLDRGTSALKELHAKGGPRIYASSVVTRGSDGTLSVREITNEGRGGTAVGALIGGLAGLPLGPLAAAIGAAGGAAIGISADVINQRDEVGFANKVSRELAPGTAAIVADVSDDGLIPFEALMKAIGGTVVRE